jgi:hypothetical protein
MCHGCRQCEFWLRFEVRVYKFRHISRLEMSHGLALMGHHNLLRHHNINHWSQRCDMKLFVSNRYSVMAAGSVSFGSGLRSEYTNLDTSHLEMCHGLALMGHHNLLGHHNINHWSHMCDMKLFVSNRYGVMAAGSVSFGSGLRSEYTNLDRSQLEMCHGLALMAHHNLLRHHNINHWSQRCDMKLFVSNRYGVMAAGSVSFGSGLRSE